MANNQTLWMCCVIQCDFSHQMDVFRWLKDDDQYRCIYICHDHDICDEERDREDESGNTTHLQVGDLKPEHIHMIIKLQKRMSPDTFSKRFGCYVNFQLCADPSEYARYFTHDTFGSKHKHHYAKSNVRGDLQLYQDLLKGQKTHDSLSVVQRYIDMVREGIPHTDIISEICSRGDADLLNSIMGHSYFYNNFFTEGGFDKWSF